MGIQKTTRESHGHSEKLNAQYKDTENQILWTCHDESLAVWKKTLYRDASVAADQEEGREGDGQRT